MHENCGVDAENAFNKLGKPKVYEVIRNQLSSSACERLDLCHLREKNSILSTLRIYIYITDPFPKGSSL